DAELVAHDLRERRLPEAWRPGEQDVVEGLSACAGRGERDLELLLDAVLADEVGERAWAQRAFELLLGVREHGRQEPARHAACLSACRTCSSTGSSGSTSTSARSASINVQPSSTSASRAVRSPWGASRPSTSVSFSFSSSTTRCAVLRPIPGIAWNRLTSSRAIAR